MTWALWLAKNDMTFEGMEIIPIDICYQIKYAYDSIWTPLKADVKRTIKEPDIYPLKLWDSSMEIVKMKQVAYLCLKD